MRRCPLYPLIALALAACATAPPLAVLNPAAMPKSWRPHGTVAAAIPQHPWTDVEQAECAKAAHTGLREIIAFFEERPDRIEEQGENALEAFLNTTYATTDSELRNLAQDWAEQCADRVAKATPNDWTALVTVANYCQSALGDVDPTTFRIIAAANQLTPASIAEPMGYSVRETLAGNPDNDQVYDLVMWSISLTDAATVQGLDLPPDAGDVLAETWAFLATYEMPPARTYAEGANDLTFYDHAYTATHIGYMPTGYGRYELRIEDAPWLYAFLRENFYAVLEMGELDLVAEFVDLLRQYGCTPTNDLQCRDGTRHLLRLHRAAGNSWISHREPYEVGEEVSDYDLLHKPWTAIAGVRERTPLPTTRGSFRWHFERATR